VWQLDAGTSQVVRRIQVGKDPRGIAFGEGSIWVANTGDGTVSRIDATSGRVVDTIEVGGSPQSVAVGEGGVWVTVYPA
jgi:YVTN family beta-propeller protein